MILFEIYTIIGTVRRRYCKWNRQSVFRFFAPRDEVSTIKKKKKKKH